MTEILNYVYISVLTNFLDGNLELINPVSA